MVNFQQLSQILYDVSMSIGRSLDLDAMLRHVAEVMLRKLNGTAFVVLETHHRQDGFEPEIKFAFPKNFEQAEACSLLLESLSEHLAAGEAESNAAPLPGDIDPPEGGTIHIMELPNFGLLAFYRAKGALSKELLMALEPIIEKLAISCIACKTHLDLENMVLERTQDLNRTVEALKLSEEQFRALFEDVPIPLCYVNEHGELAKRNKAFLRVVGYTQEEIPTLDQWWPLAYPDERYREWVMETWGKAVEESVTRREPIQPAEYEVVCKNGVKRTLEISGIVLGDAFLASFIDVTDRVQAEAELKDKMKELHRSVIETENARKDLEVFSYLSSHDLKEPLRSIAIYLNMLKKKCAQQLDASVLKYIDASIDNSRRMTELISDTLLYSKTSRDEKVIETVNLNGVIEQVQNDLESFITDRHGRVTCQDLPEVTMDRQQIYSVFLNLIKNAVKYCERDIPEVRISCTARNEDFVIAVEDNGIGIEAEYFERIFMPFKRLHGREIYEGSGVGLAIVKRVIENHGGKIWLESEPGSGTTFFFTVPSDIQSAV